MTGAVPCRVLGALLVFATVGCKRTDPKNPPPREESAAPVERLTPPPSAPGPPAPVETPAPPGSLFEALVREVGAGGPVAIAPAREGVIAVSLDGSRKRTVVAKPVDWVFVDNRSLALWFQHTAGARSDLWLLDLTQAAPSPELAVKGLPAHELIAIGYAGHGQRTTDVVKPASCEYDGCTQVLLDRSRPATQFIQGQYDAIFEDQGFAHERIVAKVQIVAAPRLKELALRGKEGALSLPIAAAAVEPDDVEAVNEDHCEDPDDCGTTQPLPGTDLLRVIVKQDCGDACHVLWQLYDPKTKQFIDFKSGRRSAKPIYAGKPGNMSDAFFSRDGGGFVIRGDVYRIDGRKVFTGVGRGGGWLGGQRYVGP
jgi:hypothetical protein